MSRNSLQILTLQKFNSLNIYKYTPLIKFSGFQFAVKGRAADLRWVKLRFRTFGFLKKKTFAYQKSFN